MMKLAPKRMLTIPRHSSVQAVEVAENVMAIDYTMDKRCWGYDFSIIKIDGHVMRVVGWGLGIEDGDLVVFGTRKGASLYRVREVKYENDPRDMWSLTADWVSREEIEHIEARTNGRLEDDTHGSAVPTMAVELGNYLHDQMNA